MNYPELLRLEKEIKILLDFRLVAYEYDHVTVEIYYAMDMSIICRIEIYGAENTIANRLAKYEAELKEGFYYEAEKKLISQMELKVILKAG